MHAIRVTEEARRCKSNRLAERQEERDVCAAELAVDPEPATEAPVAVAATEEDPTVFASRARSEHLVAKLTANDSFITDIKSGYDHDSLFAKVLKQPDQHAAFTVRDQLIWSRNRGGEQVLCVPSTKMGRQSLHGVIIDQAHTIVGHFGPQRTADYIRQWYWWPQIHREVQKFCNSCQVFLKVKEDARPRKGYCTPCRYPLNRGNGYYHFYHKNQGIAWIVIVYTAMANMKTLFIDVPGL